MSCFLGSSALLCFIHKYIHISCSFPHALKNFSNTHSVAVCLCWQYLYPEKKFCLFSHCYKKQNKTRQKSHITLPYWFYHLSHKKCVTHDVFRIKDQRNIRGTSLNHEYFVPAAPGKMPWTFTVILNSSLWLLVAKGIHISMTVIKMERAMGTFVPFLDLQASLIM